MLLSDTAEGAGSWGCWQRQHLHNLYRRYVRRQRMPLSVLHHEGDSQRQGQGSSGWDVARALHMHALAGKSSGR